MGRVKQHLMEIQEQVKDRELFIRLTIYPCIYYFN